MKQNCENKHSKRIIEEMSKHLNLKKMQSLKKI